MAPQMAGYSAAGLWGERDELRDGMQGEMQDVMQGEMKDVMQGEMQDVLQGVVQDVLQGVVQVQRDAWEGCEGKRDDARRR